MEFSRTGQVKLRTLLGARPNTQALLEGKIASDLVSLKFGGPDFVPNGFHSLIHDEAFDVGELSIMCYLQAKDAGKPLVLLPAVVLGRFQHAYLACRADSSLRPEDLEGKRVAIRSYSVTTVGWTQAILRWQFGVATERIRWIAFEGSPVDEFRDPPNVERFNLNGRTLEDMVANGEVDAAVLMQPLRDPRLRTIVRDPEAAARSWYRRFGSVQINHLVVVTSELSQQRPDVVSEIFHLLRKAKGELGMGIDVLPFGKANNYRNFEVAIDCAFENGIISKRFAVGDLFDPTTSLL